MRLRWTGPWSLAAGVLLGGWTCVWAQIATDGSLGSSPATPLTGPDYVIDQTLGNTVGDNLFHSFSQFNIHTGESATLTGSAHIANVLARVTGGSASQINGLLRTSGMPSANVFLINPNGVVFGPGAALDIGGSLVVTTADQVRLSDDGRFTASTDASQSVLTTAAPAAFGFTTPNPVGVEMRGASAADPISLAVSPGQSLAVIGGRIQLASSVLHASSGSIHLISVAGTGEVALDVDAAVTPVDVSLIDTRGDVQITDGSSLRIQGATDGQITVRAHDLMIADSAITSQVSGNAQGADVDIQLTGQLTLNQGEIFSDANLSGSAGRGGSIFIQADRILLDSEKTLTQIATHVRGGSFFSFSGFGVGGSIEITANNVRMQGRTEIATTTEGINHSGHITLTTNHLSMTGAGLDNTDVPTILTINQSFLRQIGLDLDVADLAITSSIKTFNLGLGRGGDISIHAGQGLINLEDSASIVATTLGLGQGGQVDIEADTIFATKGRSPFHSGIFSGSLGFSGDAGDINIDARFIRFEDGGLIGTDTRTNGDAGDLTINADRIELDGSVAQVITGFFVQNIQGGAAGNVGQMTINVSGEMLVRAAGVSVANLGSGQSGQLTIDADRLIVDGIGIFTPITATTFASSDGGQIVIRAGDLQLLNRGLIEASTFGAGNAGVVDIQADTITIDGAMALDIADSPILLTGISTRSDIDATGRAGDIHVNARQMITMRNRATISTFAKSANSGQINVTSDGVIDISDSTIDARAAATGADGGNIFLTAAQRNNVSDSTITGEAGREGGEISITSPFVVLHRSAIEGMAGGNDVRVVIDGGFLCDDCVINTDSLTLPPELDLSASVFNLPAALLGRYTELRPHCAVQFGPSASSFTVSTSGGTLVTSDGWLPSVDLVIPRLTQATIDRGAALTDVAGQSPDDSDGPIRLRPNIRPSP